jgi:hypothetical protein
MKRKYAVKSGMAIAEEAFTLLRGAPIEVLASYYIGSLPFVLGVLTFWATMAQSAYAHEQLGGSAFALAFLFIWMKLWQVRFARQLRAHLTGSRPERWDLRRILRTAGLQGAYHSIGIVILPAAMLALVPFPWVYAAFQNAIAIDDGSYRSIRELGLSAAQQARRWPRQNMLIIWLLSPFLLLLVTAFYLALLPVVTTLVPTWTMPIIVLYAVILSLALLLHSPFGILITVNIATGLLLGISLLQTFTGVSTVFSQAPEAASSTTFVAIVVGLAWLCLDPLLKTAYVLRCFYGDSLISGEDLRMNLRQIRQATLPILLCIAFFGASPMALAQAPQTPTSVDPVELEQSIEATLQQAEYAWRMPRATPEFSEDNVVVAGIKSALEWIGGGLKWILKRIGEFFDKLIPDGEVGGTDFEFNPAPFRFAVIALTVLLVLLLAILIYRMWRQQRQLRTPEADALAQPMPDLENEETAADALPREGWLQMARDLMQQGQWRLAMRALFLATLAGLADRKLIQVARFKANFEYKSELLRRNHAHPELMPAFNQAVLLYESVWYGEHPADRTTAEELQRRYQEVLDHA